jgi:two-component system sensor histidine kinase YesM
MMQWKFATKLLAMILLIVLVPLGIAGVYSYQSTLNALKEEARINAATVVKQIHENVQYRVEDYVRALDLIYYDQSLQSELVRSYTPSEQYAYITQSLIPLLNGAANLPTGKMRLQFYSQNSDIPEVYNTFESDWMKMERGVDIFHLARIVDEPWYDRFERTDKRNPGEVVWMQTEEDKRLGTVSVMRKLLDFRSVHHLQVGFLRGIVSLEEIFGAVQLQESIKNVSIHMVWNDGAFLYSSTGWDADRLQEELEGGEYLALRHPIASIRGELVAMLPVDRLEERAAKAGSFTIAISLASIMVVAGLSVIVTRYIGKRMKHIVRVLGEFQDGNLMKRMQIDSNDEFGTISGSFNQMADTIHQLIDEVYVTNLRKTKAELESLQMQINPHFLYNTLSSISTLANLGDMKTMNAMIQELSRFYRITLNKGEYLIAIRNEWEQAMTYLDIQRHKYRHLIDIDAKIDPDILNCYTVKIIIQPFLENCLEHAFRPGVPLKLTVRGEAAGDNVRFIVADNGKGMDTEQLHELRTAAKEAGYGIHNVGERIHLQFGLPFGITIDSEPDKGTTVIITIPKFMPKNN